MKQVEKSAHVYSLKAGDFTGYLVSEKDIAEFELGEAVYCVYALVEKMIGGKNIAMIERKHIMQSLEHLFPNLKNKMTETNVAIILNEWVRKWYLKRIKAKKYVKGVRFNELALSFEITPLSAIEYKEVLKNMIQSQIKEESKI